MTKPTLDLESIKDRPLQERHEMLLSWNGALNNAYDRLAAQRDEDGKRWAAIHTEMAERMDGLRQERDRLAQQNAALLTLCERAIAEIRDAQGEIRDRSYIKPRLRRLEEDLRAALAALAPARVGE